MWHDFPDSDMMDAMIASALKKLLNTQTHFRKRVSVEEQRAQKQDRSLRGRQTARMIQEYARATGAHEAVQGLSNLLRRPRFRRQMEPSSIFSKRNSY